MPRISIGRTTSGKDIFIEPHRGDVSVISILFGDFSTRDKFDALLAVQSLYEIDLRRWPLNQPWIEALDLTDHHLIKELGEEIITALKRDLDISSAFEARDYGRTLLHKHFRP